jgi:hypothetical protein
MTKLPAFLSLLVYIGLQSFYGQLQEMAYPGKTFRLS